jgi:hypothetical protein
MRAPLGVAIVTDVRRAKVASPNLERVLEAASAEVGVAAT